MLAEELENMIPIEDQSQTWNEAKAVVALFPYAVWRERGGDNRLLDAWSAVVRDEWGRESMAQSIITLLGEEDFDFPNWIVTLVSPKAGWGHHLAPMNTKAVARWATAALAVPYTEEVCYGVIDTMFQIADNYRLHPFIPVEIWAWLKKRPSLPPKCFGQRFMGTNGHIVRGVQNLGDIEILKSYFLVVWSEWTYVPEDGLSEMWTLMREDFGGIGMWGHRKDLTDRLEHILGELEKGLVHLQQQKPNLDEYDVQRASEDYERLKDALLEVDREAVKILTRKSLRLLTCTHYSPSGYPQNLTLHSFVPSLSPVRSRTSTVLAPRSTNSAFQSCTGSPLSPQVQLYR